MAEPLVYPDRNAALATWRTADDGVDPDRLVPDDKGLTLADLSGDCWQDRNDHRAVFLRDPKGETPYFVEAVMSGFEPADRFAQAGLVAWNDDDNYLRLTAGFLPPGYECLVELGGRAGSGGIQRLYPRTHPLQTRLRLEVGERTVAGLVSVTPGLWHPAGVLTVPEGATTRDFLAGPGIIGVGGRCDAPPRFTDWREGPLAAYRDDEFGTETGRAPWRVLLGTPGWGAPEVRVWEENGHVRIRPMSGADIFFDNSAYPCLEQPAPTAETWQLEVRVSAFDATAPGRWRKGGIVLWQGDALKLATAIVADDHFDHMYFETLADPGAAWARRHVITGHRPRAITDAVFRITRLAPDNYVVEASYDGAAWVPQGTFRIPLDEPRLRLFASGDVLMQYPGLDWSVAFDSVRATVPAAAEETNP